MKRRKHRLGSEEGAKNKSSSVIIESQQIMSTSEPARNRNINKLLRDVQVKTKNIS